MRRSSRIVSLLAAAGLLVGWLAAVAPGAQAAAGDFDVTFGKGGIATLDLGRGANPTALAIQRDGKIVVAGYTYAPPDFLLARFNPDGSPDGGFGSGGVVTTDFGAADLAQGVALGPHGTIVVAGVTEAGTTSKMAVARYTVSGALDPTFNGGGKSEPALGNGDQAANVFVLPTGQVLLAGDTAADIISKHDVAVLRLNADGSPDPTFGTGGRTVTDLGRDLRATSAALQTDGKLLVGSNGVTRYTADGKLDTSFGVDGTASAPGENMTVQPNGRIVTAGMSPQGLGLVALRPDGSTEDSFGAMGFSPVAIGGYNAQVRLGQAPDGKLVVAGAIPAGTPPGTHGALTRLGQAGGVDPSFGEDGTVTSEDFGAQPVVTAQSDDKPVIAFSTTTGLAVARFLATRPPVAPLQPITTGAGASGGPVVDSFLGTGSATSNFFGFPGAFRGGVRVARGDVDPSPGDEIVVGSGPGQPPFVNVFDPAGNLLHQFEAYSSAFTGGVYVTVGNVDGHPGNEIITGAGEGGGPHVRVFTGDGSPLGDGFMAYDTAFRGGVRVAAGNLNGSGLDEIITGAGPGGGPHVRVVTEDGTSAGPSFYAYNIGFTGGVFVASGDVAGDAADEIVTGAGAGGSPRVEIFNGAGTGVANFLAYDPAFGGGVTVGVADVDGSAPAEVITGAGPGGGPHVEAFAADGTLKASLIAYDLGFTGGVFVSGFRPSTSASSG
jgi:fibronectin-binding autotransporter adhesin